MCPPCSPGSKKIRPQNPTHATDKMKGRDARGPGLLPGAMSSESGKRPKSTLEIVKDMAAKVDAVVDMIPAR